MSNQADKTTLDALVYAPAHEQARALAAGEVSATDLLEHILARIDRHNPELNAVIARDDAAARKAATLADEALARGERRPLLGVPVTVKENFHVAGLVTSVGNTEFAGNVSPQDAPAVTALREAGAVIVGKTNVPLALADLQTYNNVYGVTRNPWDLDRTPGGSSGGSAVAIAAGLSALELGTDIGGSIRVPAHFTGIYGHKPTFGLVYNGGTGAPAGKLALRDLTVAGPLARSAEDLELALKILLNRDPLASKAWRAELPPARHGSLDQFRVLLLTRWPGRKQSASEKLVESRLKQGLQAAGVQVVAPDAVADLLPDLEAAHVLYRTLLGASLAIPSSARATAVAEAAEPVSTDVRKRAERISHGDWLQNNEQRFQLRAQWERLFERIDLVLSPVFVSGPFVHDHTEPKDERIFPVAFDGEVKELKFADLFDWSGLPVLPGLPATSFPIGLDEAGLPVGAQAVGPYLEDLTPIRFAQLFTAGQGGFIAPSGFT
ncbi:amidase [Herbaspirillum sp. alder98]|uniref:amidase n=1 Tax=Herbaspirillum sp. alder98 TaxID=2913096 RepID=UPI001CD8285C|nr:amidase [Herbaspirillum sp. alder98]MCA1326087.1 amidase [Herbaspirillum sp. alder98]